MLVKSRKRAQNEVICLKWKLESGLFILMPFGFFYQFVFWIIKSLDDEWLAGWHLKTIHNNLILFNNWL